MKSRAKTIVFEGFYDLNSGHDFDMPVFMVKPVRVLKDAGSATAGIEGLIEDFVLNLDLGERNRHETGYSKKLIEADFDRAKKRSRRFRYWSAVVEVPESEDDGFIIRKARGFKTTHSEGERHVDGSNSDKR